jgi:Phage tail tube protein, GTA-gp10
MANRARGEVELEAGGRVFRLRLTLGALAEIEDGLSLDDLSQVEARLKKLRAADLAIVAAALMRGGGHEIAAVEVLHMAVDLAALVQAVTAAFASSTEAESESGSNGPFGAPRSKPASA